MYIYIYMYTLIYYTCLYIIYTPFGSAMSFLGLVVGLK